jgi:hypothetical protein
MARKNLQYLRTIVSGGFRVQVLVATLTRARLDHISNSMRAPLKNPRHWAR